MEGVRESAQQLSTTEWLINTDHLQNIQGARTGYVSDDVVHDWMGEGKGHLGNAQTLGGR